MSEQPGEENFERAFARARAAADATDPRTTGPDRSALRPDELPSRQVTRWNLVLQPGDAPFARWADREGYLRGDDSLRFLSYEGAEVQAQVLEQLLLDIPGGGLTGVRAQAGDAPPV
ncbi:hypothetical protein AB0D08_01825 [Kitasatospora sp. NPDC048540]|uniref:hypothetical protein n=1 Tax=unclassified Kitasatospora TaxID=2633591 RepID=UPI000539D8B5|nr:hypothetical protein [Kitasatospora sp. MBT63]